MKKFITLIAAVLVAATVYGQSLKDAMKPAVKQGGFKMDGYFLWCPSVIKVGNTYHMFASRWPEAS
jgi:hypothetical protein